VLLHSPGDEALQVLPARDVRLADGHATATGANLLGQQLQSLGPTRAEHHVRAAVGEQRRRRAAVAAGAPDPRSRERLHAAITLLFDAAVQAGAIRSDVDAEDVSATLVGIAMAAGGPDSDAQRRRMIDLVFDGLRRPA